MIHYLPAKSHVVVRDSARKVFWYDTRLEIDFAEEPQMVQCPIRNQPVMTVNFQGFDVFFLSDQAKYKLSQEETDRIASMQLYKLEYDIPQNTNMWTDEHPWRHPSDYLWSIGIRTSDSCWLIPKALIPYPRFNRLTEVGARWECLKQDVSETPALIDACCKALTYEYKQAVQRAQETDQRSQEALENGNRNPELTEEKIKKAELIRAKRLEKAAKERFAELESGANVFGLNVRYYGMQTAQTAIAAIGLSMKQRAAAFAKALQVATAPEIATSDTVALAAIVREDPTVAPILADALQDAGQEGAAISLRAAANPPAEPTEGSDEFSLLDLEAPENTDTAA